MLRLVPQSGCFSEPVPLQGVPPLKLKINCQSPVNRTPVFITPLFTCLRARRPLLSRWQPRAEREGEREREKAANPAKGEENLAYLCLCSSLLRASPTSSSATFSSSVHLRQGEKNKKINHSETNGFHIGCIFYRLLYLTSFCRECRHKLATGGKKLSVNSNPFN